MTTSGPGQLLERWRALVGASPTADAAGRALLERWTEPHRRYHALPHLAAVLDALDLLAPAAPEVVDLDAVELAAWFHDAVYDGQPGADEEASATLAATVLGDLGEPAARTGEVVRLIRLTIGHAAAPGDVAGGLLCDADLAVLGADPAAYAAYAAAIREEYADVPEDAFDSGRAAVLEALLSRTPLFSTPAAQQQWEAAARRNMAAELARLTG